LGELGLQKLNLMNQVGFTYSKVLIGSDEFFQFHDTLAAFGELALSSIQVTLESGVLMNELKNTVQVSSENWAERDQYIIHSPSV